MEVASAPLSAACRGVALWMGAGISLIAVLTAAGVMRPAWPNEPPVAAVAFVLGALVGAAAVWRREPARPAIAWMCVNLLLAVAMLAFPVALGLSR